MFSAIARSHGNSSINSRTTTVVGLWHDLGNMDSVAFIELASRPLHPCAQTQYGLRVKGVRSPADDLTQSRQIRRLHSPPVKPLKAHRYGPEATASACTMNVAGTAVPYVHTHMSQPT